MAKAADSERIWKDFNAAVNMPQAKLAAWLETEEGKAVGWKGADGKAAESVGHKSGRRIIAIRSKKKAELEPDDYAHMRKVVGYVRRHLAQRPEKNVAESRWRYSLMNWGHDPCL